jgi:hypothetical protein
MYMSRWRNALGVFSMTNPPAKSAVQQRIRRARVLLFLQRLLDLQVWLLAAGLLASAAWFAAQPWVTGATDPAWRWYGAAAIMVFAFGTGAWLTTRSAPSPVEAALEVDRRFDLQERMTSCSTLNGQSAQSPAGLALLADAEAHAAKITIGERFRVRPNWTAVLPPVAAVALVLVAYFYAPVFKNSDDASGDSQRVANAKEIADKFNSLKKTIVPVNLKADTRSEKLKEIEAMRDKLLQDPLDPNDKDSIRERLQKMVPLGNKIQERIDDLRAQQDRNQTLKEQLKNWGNDPNNKMADDGPAKDLADALRKGDVAKAQKELQALADKLKKGELTKEEQQQLEKQLQNLRQNLEDLANQKAAEQQLRKDLLEGKISQDEFERRMAELQERRQRMNALKALGQCLGECQACVGGGQFGEAGAMLDEAAEMLRNLDFAGGELDDLLRDQQRLAELADLMCQGMGGVGGPPGGLRPIDDSVKTGSKLAKQNGEMSPNTVYRITGERKGGTFSKIPASQVGGAFQQAQQEAPQAIERQQVPAEAAELLRGYYENLGGGSKK